MSQIATHNAIAWNRERMERALRDRNGPDKERSIAACQNAQRFANNIAALQEQLGEQS